MFAVPSSRLRLLMSESLRSCKSWESSGSLLLFGERVRGGVEYLPASKCGVVGFVFPFSKESCPYRCTGVWTFCWDIPVILLSSNRLTSKFLDLASASLFCTSRLLSSRRFFFHGAGSGSSGDSAMLISPMFVNSRTSVPKTYARYLFTSTDKIRSLV